jgi:amidohydrolase
MDFKKQIHSLSDTLFAQVVELRRHFHAYPELSNEEHKTSAFIKEFLKNNQIPYKDGYAKTGIVANIQGTKGGDKKVIALRADMDALPVNELNDLSFASMNPGVMHACGHDVHMACLMGAALILNQLKHEFGGTITLIFQPAEEKLPGGAKLMIEQGALESPKPDLVLGLHVEPDLPSGVLGFKPGIYMASTDELYITVKGKGGHAAMPDQLIDPVLIAAHIITALQQIVSRHAKASIPSVLSFGKVIANGATNIIPDEVRIEGTFRTMNESWRATAHKKMTNLIKSIAEGMGGSVDLKIEKGYPFLVNDVEVTNKAKKYASELLGNEHVVDLDIRMTAEDFAYYSQKYPSTFFRLGVKPDDIKNPSPLHSSLFNPDEQALRTGMAALAWLAVSFLKE